MPRKPNSRRRPRPTPNTPPRRHRHTDFSAQPGILDEDALLRLIGSLPQPPLILVLDSITDPHNLGACLRSADAAGAHAVVVPKDRSAGLTDTVRHVAVGAAEHIPFVAVTNLARTLDLLKEAGLWIVGTTHETERVIYDLDLTTPLALVMGSEGRGLRRLVAEKCDFLAKIPMAGHVENLNVSVAAGICLFEAVRQRRGRTPGLP